MSCRVVSSFNGTSPGSFQRGGPRGAGAREPSIKIPNSGFHWPLRAGAIDNQDSKFRIPLATESQPVQDPSKGGRPGGTSPGSFQTGAPGSGGHRSRFYTIFSCLLSLVFFFFSLPPSTSIQTYRLPHPGCHNPVAISENRTTLPLVVRQ